VKRAARRRRATGTPDRTSYRRHKSVRSITPVLPVLNSRALSARMSALGLGWVKTLRMRTSRGAKAGAMAPCAARMEKVLLRFLNRPEFSHSQGQNANSSCVSGTSAVEPVADVIKALRGRLYRGRHTAIARCR
jgi:hypothetical protein